MENNYYEMLLEEIQSKIDNANFKEAEHLVDAELSMPYIPIDIETRLYDFKKILLANKPSSNKRQYYDVEQIEAMLEGTEEEQLFMIEYLSKSNLRDYREILQKFFLKSHNHLVENLMIDALVRQGIHESFILNRQGLEIHFIPALLEIPTETEGFQACHEYLTKKFESENPSFLIMAIEILLFQVYWQLPNQYDIDEAELLAQSIAISLFEQLHDFDAKTQFIKENDINESNLLEVVMPF